MTYLLIIVVVGILLGVGLNWNHKKVMQKNWEQIDELKEERESIMKEEPIKLTVKDELSDEDEKLRHLLKDWDAPAKDVEDVLTAEHRRLVKRAEIVGNEEIRKFHEGGRNKAQ